MATSKVAKQKVKIALIGVAIGLVLGIASTLFLQNFNPKDDKPSTDPVSIVFDRIVAQNELVCASQMYNITAKASNSNSFFDLFDIPFTENSFWYRYVGTIKVGVDLSEAALVSPDTSSVIKIELNPPCIISNTPDMNKSGILEENNNLFNPIHVQDVDAFQRQCIEQSETEILQGNIMEEARQNAEKDLNELFNVALGNTYTVEIQWRETNEE